MKKWEGGDSRYQWRGGLRNTRERRMENTGERLSGSYNRNFKEILSP